jgi:hypothetical protein
MRKAFVRGHIRGNSVGGPNRFCQPISSLIRGLFWFRCVVGIRIRAWYSEGLTRVSLYALLARPLSYKVDWLASVEAVLPVSVFVIRRPTPLPGCLRYLFACFYLTPTLNGGLLKNRHKCFKLGPKLLYVGIAHIFISYKYTNLKEVFPPVRHLTPRRRHGHSSVIQNSNSVGPLGLAVGG